MLFHVDGSGDRTSDTVGIQREMAAKLYLEIEAASAELLAIEREVRDALDSVGQAADAPTLIASARTWLDEAGRDIRRRALLIEPPDDFVGPLSPANLLHGARPMTRHQVGAASRPIFNPFNNGWTARNPPRAQHAKLRKIVEKLYRPTARLGSGSTADALRGEIADNVRYSERGHYQKVVDTINELKKRSTIGDLRPGDARIADHLLRDLSHAKQVADATAQTSGHTAQSLLDTFPRRPSSPPVAAGQSRGAGRIAGAAASVVGRLFTPLLLPSPCTIDTKTLSPCRKDVKDHVA